MPKNKIHTKLKTVLHPNRYFIWALCLLFISAFALASYIYVTEGQQDLDSVYPFLAQRKVFVDYKQKYSVTYPANWQLERDAAGRVVFEDPSATDEGITVELADPGTNPQALIAGAVKIQSQDTFIRGNLKITLIRSETKNNSNEFDIGLINTGSKVYYVSGYSPYFTSFVLNLKPF